MQQRAPSIGATPVGRNEAESFRMRRGLRPTPKKTRRVPAGVVTKPILISRLNSGGLVERSLLGTNVRVNSFSYVTDSIIMNNCNIGRHARIRRTIIDKNVHVPENYEIGFDIESDKKKFHVTDSGIVVIGKNQILT